MFSIWPPRWSGAKRRTVSNAEVFVNDQTRVLGLMRRSGRVKVRNDIPPFRSSLSKHHGITGNELTSVAVLDLGSKEVIILASERAAGQSLHLNLRRRIVDAGYRITDERLADVSLITEVNDALTKGGIDRDASDVGPVVEEMFSKAISDHASDIHICCRENSGMVLFRIHSKIFQYRGFNVNTCEQMASYMYTLLALPRTRSSGSFSLELKSFSCVMRHSECDDHYNLRLKFVRLADGWDVVIRILLVEDPGAESITFQELGFERSQIEILQMCANRSIGMIAIAGPTGGGKSTTLKVVMESDEKKMFKKRYSFEDPVEYKIFLVSQISLQRDEHENDEDAATGTLRDILRADPDELMLGEIRDRVMMQMGADFVLSGHKMLTSIHAASGFEIPIRVHRLGLERNVLASKRFIAALLFQRLVPVLCPECKVPAADVLSETKQHLLKRRYKLDVNAMFCASKEGCEHCRGRGVVASTVVAELIVPDPVIRQKINDGKDEEAEKYWRKTRTTGFNNSDMTGKTAFEHGLYKVSQGIVDLRDLEDEFDPLEFHEIIPIENEVG